jgi:hypothetical protein
VLWGGGGGGGDTALPISAPGWQLGCMYQLMRETAQGASLAQGRQASRRTGALAHS